MHEHEDTRSEDTRTQRSESERTQGAGEKPQISSAVFCVIEIIFVPLQSFYK